MKYLFMMVLSIILVSCAPEADQDSLLSQVSVSVTYPVFKVIEYDGSGAVGSMRYISSYRLSVSAADGSGRKETSWIECNTGSSRWEIKGLQMGKSYIFTAYGAIAMEDGSYSIIAEDSRTVDISSSAMSISIELRSIVPGNADSLSLQISPPEDAEGDLLYEWALSDIQGNILYSLSDLLLADGMLTINDSSLLPSGRYVMTITAEDKDGHIWKASEAARLYPGLPASGSISFLGNEPEDSDISIEDGLGGEIDISGPSASYTVTIGTPKILALSSGTIDSERIGQSSIVVFINGNQLSADDGFSYAFTAAGGASLTIPTDSLLIGRNIVTICISDGTAAGTGSRDIIFTGRA